MASTTDLSNDFQVIDSTVDTEEAKGSKKSSKIHNKKEKTIKDSPKGDAKANDEDIESSKVSNDASEECKNCQKNCDTNKVSAQKNNEKPRSEKKSVKETDIEKQKQADYLIITEEEEDLDTSIDVNKPEEEGLCEESDKSQEASPKIKQQIVEEIEKPPKKKESSHKHVWVSNVSRGIKASELKKVFSAHAKVTTAKIMTNGKRFFGYICFETSEMAERCVKELHNTKVAGKRIAVSIQRPDLRASSSNTEDVKRKSDVEVKKNVEVVPEKSEEAPIEKPTEKVEPTPKKVKRTPKDKGDLDEEKIHLQKRLRAAQADLMTYKKRLADCQNELQVKTDRCRNLRKDLDKVTDQLHHERRRINQERDQFKEKQKMEQIRFDTDRTMLNKEIDECKKLREYLESKINELADSRKRKAKSRSPLFRRSPPSVRRDVRHNPPPRPRHDVPEKRGRFELSKERNRTPPPPPKLSTEKSLGRGHDSYSTIKVKNPQPRHSSPAPPRGHYMESNRRGENSRAVVAPPLSATHSRNPPWQTSYPGQVWRSTGYGDSFQGPPGAAPRDNMFYPSFGKNHPSVDSANRRY